MRIALVACLALLVGAAGTSAATKHGSSIELNAAACHDPVVHDHYNGFHIGVPGGWYLSSVSGLIVVFPNYNAKTEAVVQTAFVSSGQSARSFLSRMAALFAADAKRAGNSLSFHFTSSTTATVTGRVGTTALAGAASVSFVPIHSAHGARLGVMSGYWAPTAQLAGVRAKLASVGACFGPERGTLSRFFQDQAFAYTLPLGWKVSENPDELFLSEGPNAWPTSS